MARGEFVMPGNITLTIPTGRFVKADGSVLLEGSGVVPQVTVPITEESLISGEDTVLQAALDYIQNHSN